MTETAPVICPSCGEAFEVALPPAGETPCEVDYDCEVCCRPMVISFAPGAGDAAEVSAEARGWGDA